MPNHRFTAKTLLKHYFRILFNQTNLIWRWDNGEEIDEIVDKIIDAAKEEIMAEVRSKLLTYKTLEEGFKDEIVKEILEEIKGTFIVSDTHIGDYLDMEDYGQNYQNQRD